MFIYLVYAKKGSASRIYKGHNGKMRGGNSFIAV